MGYQELSLWLLDSKIKLFKKAKNLVQAFLYPASSLFSNVLTFNNATDINFTHPNLFHFWTPFLSVVWQNKIKDEQNILWIAHYTDHWLMDTLYTIFLTFIITVFGFMIRFFNRSAIEKSEMNKNILQSLNFSLVAAHKWVEKNLDDIARICQL